MSDNFNLAAEIARVSINADGTAVAEPIVNPPTPEPPEVLEPQPDKPAIKLDALTIQWCAEFVIFNTLPPDTALPKLDPSGDILRGTDLQLRDACRNQAYSAYHNLMVKIAPRQFYQSMQEIRDKYRKVWGDYETT